MYWAFIGLQQLINQWLKRCEINWGGGGKALEIRKIVLDSSEGILNIGVGGEELLSGSLTANK